MNYNEIQVNLVPILEALNEEMGKFLGQGAVPRRVFINTSNNGLYIEGERYNETEQRIQTVHKLIMDVPALTGEPLDIPDDIFEGIEEVEYKEGSENIDA